MDCEGVLREDVMWCMKCNNELADCICPDLIERLSKVSHFSFEVCAKCGKHHSQCKCEQPDRKIVRGRPNEAT